MNKRAPRARIIDRQGLAEMLENVVEVPFSYTVTGIGKGQRNTEDHSVLDTLTVELQDLSASEIPAVLQWNDQVYRSFEGRLVRPMQRPWTEYPRHPGNLGDLMDAQALNSEVRRFLTAVTENKARGWDDYPLPMVRSDESHSGFIVGAINPKFRAIYGNDREAAAHAAAVSAVQQMVLIDGIVHSEVQEPSWLIRFERHDANLFSYLWAEDKDLGLVYYRNQVRFRMDDKDEAIRFVREMGAHAGVIPTKHDGIEVVGDFSWRRAAAEETLRGNASYLTSQIFDFAQQSLWMHGSFLGAFAALRDLDIKTASIPALCDVFSGLNEAARLSTHNKCWLLSSRVEEATRTCLLRASFPDALIDPTDQLALDSVFGGTLP